MGSVVLTGQVSTTAGAGSTLKVAWQVTSASQLLETVHVTVTDPPQKLGAAGALLEIIELQPPEYVAVASHAAYAASTCAWV